MKRFETDGRAAAAEEIEEAEGGDPGEDGGEEEEAAPRKGRGKRKPGAVQKQAIVGAKRANAFSMDPDELTVIGIDTHHTAHGKEDDGTHHPLYDDRIKLPVDPNKVRNVKAKGVIKPIVVRKEFDPKTKTERHVVVDGRQRTRWAREANAELRKEGAATHKVIVIVRKYANDGEAFGVTISANEIAETDGVLTKARKALQFQNMGYTIDETALQFGVSAQSVRNWNALMDLATPVQKMVDDGKLGAMAAAKLVKIQDKAEQIDAAEKMIAEGRTSVESVARAVRGKGNGKGGGASEKEAPAYEIPGRRQLRAVVTAHEKGEAGDLDPMAVKVIRCLTGDLHPRSIKGLLPLLTAAGYNPGD